MVSLSRVEAMNTEVAASPIASRWTERYRKLTLAADFLAVSTALLAAYFVRFGDTQTSTALSGGTFNYGQATAAIAVIWLLALAASDAWSRRVLGNAIAETRAVLTATLGAFGAVAILSYLAQISFSRAIFITALPLGCLLLTLGRFVARIRLRRLRAAGRALTPTIIVGDRADIVHTVRHIRDHPYAGYRPAAVCPTDERKDNGGSVAGEELLDLHVIQLEDIPAYAAALETSAVAITGGLNRGEVRSLAWALEDSAADLMMVSRLTDVTGPRTHMSNVQGLGLTHVQLPRYKGINHVLKRSFDLFFSATSLILLSPILLLIALAIKLDDGGPVLFRQERIGLRGRPFTIHKFRTMTPDAESKIQELIAANGGRALLFKADNDPRITRIGHFLRKYSLDELPQFWTVLKGSMSVVGPRPQVAREVAEYDSATHRRLLIKPGITGLWQVNGRSSLSIERSIRLDLGYVENWSLSGDLAIIIRTIWVVVRPNGAY